MKRISHKAGLLSAVMLLLLLAAPITALANGEGEEFTQTVDGYQVTLILEKPLSSGENQIHIRVGDAQGQPVSNAQIEVGVVDGAAEHTEAQKPTAQSNMQDGMDAMSATEVLPTPQDGMQGMGDMSTKDVPTATLQSTMPGMGDTSRVVASPTALPDEHDEMGMAAFAAGHEAGEYEGEIAIAGAGEWTIRVHLTVDNHLIEFNFPVHLAGSQAGSNILLGFFAINAVILGTAATLKLKPAKA